MGLKCNLKISIKNQFPMPFILPIIHKTPPTQTDIPISNHEDEQEKEQENENLSTIIWSRREAILDRKQSSKFSKTSESGFGNILILVCIF